MVKFAAWPTSWRPPGADRLPQMNHSELSHMAGAVDDSTINIVVVIIIIIISHPRILKVGPLLPLLFLSFLSLTFFPISSPLSSPLPPFPLEVGS